MSEVKKIVDQEFDYDDPEEGAYAENVALNTNVSINLRAMPFKIYLDQTVTPYLAKALTECAKIRPPNPAEFVAYYLLENHPSNKAKKTVVTSPTSRPVSQ